MATLNREQLLDDMHEGKLDKLVAAANGTMAETMDEGLA